ncbi:glycosyltransferase family 4 protein [uncultured Sphingomonas sp.]|uniref:glycosyltransferase family 4 protein n=1 Tax=uncultured Sphingomonas sp. TaxID=158754 RepID=UPI0035CA128A
MELLFDCHTFDAGPQGTTTFLAGLIDALPEAARKRSLPLAVTCAARDPDAVSRFVETSCRFEEMRGGFAARNLVELPRLTRQPGLDAVVSQYVRPFRSSAPTVSVIHDVLFLDFPALFGWRYRMMRQLLFGWAARHSDVVITVSAYSRARIAHHFGVDPARIDVLTNAVDVTTPLPRPQGRAAGAPLKLLYVSRFEIRKRQHWCVAAANALAKQGYQVELTLVGDASGAYAASVRAAIVADRVPGAVVSVRSDVSRDDLHALFAEADLFLFPSECEGFGIPVIEAAANGVPCVVAANTAMIELENWYAGLAVRENDRAAFVGSVVTAVARLPALRHEAADRAPKVRAAFRWPEVADEFVGILQRRGVIA